MADYVGSKMDWIDAGLPYEGSLASTPNLGLMAASWPDFPTCRLDDTTDDVRARLGEWPLAVVLNGGRVVLGTVTVAALAESGRSVGEVMKEGPSTYRPHVTAEELAPKLGSKVTTVVVTTLTGELVGLVPADAIRRAAPS